MIRKILEVQIDPATERASVHWVDHQGRTARGSVHHAHLRRLVEQVAEPEESVPFSQRPTMRQASRSQLPTLPPGTYRG
jgi:hypothetical protein